MDGETFGWWTWWIIGCLAKWKNPGLFEGLWALKIGWMVWFTKEDELCSIYFETEMFRILIEVVQEVNGCEVWGENCFGEIDGGFVCQPLGTI